MLTADESDDLFLSKYSGAPAQWIEPSPSQNPGYTTAINKVYVIAKDDC